MFFLWGEGGGGRWGEIFDKALHRVKLEIFGQI